MDSGTVAANPDASAVQQNREALGLSRERLAALADLSARTIYNIEHGLVRPQRATAHVLAEALDCDPAEILPTNRKRPAITRGAPQDSARHGRHGRS